MSLAKQGKRQVPSFDDVGTKTGTNTEVKPDTEVENKPEVNPDNIVDNQNKPEVDNKEDNSIEAIVGTVTDKPKEKPKRQISIYLDDDVAKEFERFGKKHGKGAKSDLINQFLKKVFNK
jgi:uncharacterized protein (DUF4415 family)